MTPEERADKIVLASRQDRYSNAVAFKEVIAAEIEAAIKEAHHTGVGVCDECEEQGMALAYEDAAKIVEAFHPLQGLRPDIERHDEAMREMLASNIRARAREVAQ